MKIQAKLLTDSGTFDETTICQCIRTSGLLTHALTKGQLSRPPTKEEIDIFVYTFFEDLLNKKLVIDDKIPFPVSTFNRSYKYTDYGFKLCRESKIKLLLKLSSLTDINEEELGLSLYESFD